MKRPYPLINTQKKLILFSNAKCGGTTLKSWFVDSLDLEHTFSNTFYALKYFGFYFVFKWYKYRFLNHDLEKIKFSNAYLRKFIKIYRVTTIGKIKKHINDSDFLRVAVVRNPYDRLVSGFVDKFCGDDINRYWVQEVIKQIDSKDSEGNYQITFSQFVDYLYNNDLTEVNSHWRHQTHILKGIHLDRLIDLKDMSVKLPELSKELKIDTNINFNERRQSNNYNKDENVQKLKDVYDTSNLDLIQLKTKNGFFPSKEVFYNEEIKQKVRTIYKDDFEALGYD